MPDSNVRRLEFQRTPLPNFEQVQYRVLSGKNRFRLNIRQSQSLPEFAVGNIVRNDLFGKGYWKSGRNKKCLQRS